MLRWKPGKCGADRGQSTLDYLGMVVVVAAIIGALVAAGIGRRIAEALQVAICRLLGGDCQLSKEEQRRPVTDEDFKPLLCNIENRTDASGGKIKIAFLEFGRDYSFAEQTFADNTPEARKRNGGKPGQRIMLTFNDSVSADVKRSKPGLKIGKLNKGDIEFGGGLKVGAGDTWVFHSKEEADKFRDDLWQLELAKRNAMTADSGIGAAFGYEDLKGRVQKKMGDNKISFSKVSVNVGVDLSITGADKAKSGNGGEGGGALVMRELDAQLGIKGKLGNEVTAATNRAVKPPLAQKTYTVEAEYDGKASVEGAPFELGGELGQKYTGTITVSRYEDGSLARVDMTRSVQTRGKTGGEAKKTRDSGQVDDKGHPKKNKGTGKRSDKTTSTETTTNSVIFPKDDQSPETLHARKTAEEWLKGGSKYGSPWVYAFAGDQALRKDPGADDRFGHMLFQRGISSRTTHAGMADAQEYGLEVNLGLSLGASFGVENDGQEIEEAEFLGAPKPGGTRSYLPYGYCAQ